MYNISMQEKNVRKVLFLRIGAIGDIIHTLNAPRALKEIYPEVEIYYLANISAEFLTGVPYIDKPLVLPSMKHMKIFSKSMRETAKMIKAENFDMVINLQPSIKTRLLMRLAGIKKVYNYRKNKHHAVMNYWETVKRAFPKISLAKDLKYSLKQQYLETIKPQIENLKKPLIIFNAGHVFAKRQGRTYPIEKWIELGNLIQNKYDGTIVITGVKADAEVLKPLENIKNSISFVDKLSLQENSALISFSDLLISGDSGPLHIAASLGVKAIGLFGSMPISRTGPYGENCHTILSPKKCSPCNHIKCKYLKKTKELYAPCMKEIEPLEIFKKVEEILS